MYVQHGSSLRLARGHMRQPINARHLLARCAGLLLPVIGDDLRQWSVQRPGGRGVVLHQHVHDRGDLYVEHEHSDMRCRSQRLHHHHHLDLLEWGVQRPGGRGFMLHQRLYAWGNAVSVEHEPPDMRRRGQRLHRLQHHLDLLGRAGLRALCLGRVRGS